MPQCDLPTYLYFMEDANKFQTRIHPEYSCSKEDEAQSVTTSTHLQQHSNVTASTGLNEPDMAALSGWWPAMDPMAFPYPQSSVAPLDETNMLWPGPEAFSDNALPTCADYQGGIPAQDLPLPLSDDWNMDDFWLATENTDILLDPQPAVAPEQNTTGSSAADRPRNRTRIPQQARNTLDRWFQAHITDPYIEKSDVISLSQSTGLSVRQIRTYFANCRARRLPNRSSTASDTASKSSENILPASIASPIPITTASHIIRQDEFSRTAQGYFPSSAAGPSDYRSLLQQDPMERFLSSSPEEEGISEDALRSASQGFDLQQSRGPSHSRSSSVTNMVDFIGNLPIDTTYTGETQCSSASTSGSSQATIDTAQARAPRRGRKRQGRMAQREKPIARNPIDPRKIFQCTFCTKEFGQKYDWRRHEESVHFPQQEWICMPDGPAVAASYGGLHCAFCDMLLPSSEHFDEHNCSPCLTSLQSERTFTRKDKLLQHLTQVHKISQLSSHMLAWTRPVERDVVMTCGICGVDLPGWTSRVDHISSHFTEGQSMALWLEPPGGIAPRTKPASLPSTPPVMGPLHHCLQCGAILTKYLEAIYHERQVHTIYRVRQQTEEVQAKSQPRPPLNLQGSSRPGNRPVSARTSPPKRMPQPTPGSSRTPMLNRPGRPPVLNLSSANQVPEYGFVDGRIGPPLPRWHPAFSGPESIGQQQSGIIASPGQVRQPRFRAEQMDRLRAYEDMMEGITTTTQPGGVHDSPTGAEGHEQEFSWALG